ncbi:MAG: hydrogenase [Planctomycetes bacterium]|nr:hydrogenase [Planctomycetota bacterium]
MGLFVRRSSLVGQRIATLMMVFGQVCGIAGAVSFFHSGEVQSIRLSWPAAGDSLVGLDALSAFFLIPVFLIGGLGSIYDLGYFPQSLHPRNGRKLRLFYGGLVAGMALLVVSRHALAFLFGWEAMALSAFFLVSTEDHRRECRRSALIYLVATHVGTLSLFALFSLWKWSTGSFILDPAAGAGMSFGVVTALFLLALIGFGLKAGIMPLHFWLPGAHANAPSHVSAILSGVMLKMGIYGLVRVLSLLPDPPGAFGGLLITLGAISGLLGVVFAIGQHDLKRLLAYHSVENIGIILMGLGLAMLGRSEDRPEWVALGMAGCLLHVWNHALFKSLLFYSAGSVVHGAHTRQIDRLGGLYRRMPLTGTMFLVGAVAICGLPPLNGFVSEFFVYVGLLESGISEDGGGLGAVIAVPVLAMTGALALACFVKVFGSVFLGNPRSESAANCHESPFTMRIPMIVLAICCFAIGLAPALLGPVLDGAIRTWNGGATANVPGVGDVAPLREIGVTSISLVGAVLLFYLFMAIRGRRSEKAGTWDCGYAIPTSRMQYTASSFAKTIALMFGWALGTRTHGPRVEGSFPEPSSMESHVDDAVLDRLIVPLSLGVTRWFRWFRRFQQGLTQHYVLYILITVVAMLCTLMPFDEFITRLFER